MSITRSAIISECGTYRYSLTREWEQGDGAVLFIMLNPSTADGSQDDPTIRRCMGFAQAWGAKRLEVRNLFAYRATKPKDMIAAQKMSVDIVGPENAAGVLCSAASATKIVCAWGAQKEARYPGKRMINSLLDAGLVPWALRITSAGAPEHPLFVPASVEPARLSRQWL